MLFVWYLMEIWYGRVMVACSRTGSLRGFVESKKANLSSSSLI